MIKAPRLYQFSLLFPFLFVALGLHGQNFPPVTPQNMSAVVAEIYAQYGAQIQVSPDEMTLFLSNMQPNYTTNMETPYPNAINNTPESLTFVWDGPDDQATAVGVLNTINNQQMTDLTLPHTYTFNNLNTNDLYLFAFANTRGERQGSINVTIGTLGFIIIVDEKIMYTGECNVMQSVGVGNNQVSVQLNPNDGAFFQISVKGCNNSLVSSDVCYLWMENNGAAISGVLVPVLSANSDNFVLPFSNNIGSLTPGAATLSLRSIFNTALQQYDHFRISNAIAWSPCAQIAVKRCGSEPHHENPVLERTAENNPLPAGVSPNPVHDFAHIILPGKNLDKAQIVVVNSLGAIAKTVSCIPEETALYTINMQDLAAGIYFVHVILEKEVVTFKVLKTME